MRWKRWMVLSGQSGSPVTVGQLNSIAWALFHVPQVSTTNVTTTVTQNVDLTQRNVSYHADPSVNLTVSLPFLLSLLTTVPSENSSPCGARTWSPGSRRRLAVKAPIIKLNGTVVWVSSVHVVVYSRPLPTRALTSPVVRCDNTSHSMTAKHSNSSNLRQTICFSLQC